MTKTVKFSVLSDGETFKSAGRPNGDTFRKESDENWEGEGGCTLCGCENSWNALNTSDKKGEFFVKGLIKERYFGEEYSMMRACDTLKAEGVTGTDQFQEDFIKGNWK